MKNLTIKLAHRPNPDLFDRGGYWDEPAESGKTQTVPVNSYAEAAKVARDYINRNHLGGGNWTGGNIYQGRTKIGHVSYNGRVWDNDGNEILVDKNPTDGYYRTV